MGQRDFGFLLVPLVALLAIFVPAIGPSKSQPEAPKVNVPVPSEVSAGEAGKNAPELLTEYYAGSPGQVNAQSCIIATVPDPIDAANLNYTYDRYLDSIQRAMEVSGYVLDRYDVPWLDNVKVDDPKRPPEPRFRREPARLLFRRTSQPTSPAPVSFVFLVGETPTSGIEKTAFQTALEEYSQVCVATGTINVLGPSFSGSQDSLHILLTRRKPSYRFRVISGSATAMDTAVLLKDAPESSFQLTVARDRNARTVFLRQIADREAGRVFQRVRHALEIACSWRFADCQRDHPTKVALLVEGSTAFGQSATPAIQTTIRPIQIEHVDSSAADEEIPRSIQLIRIPFPLHISNLRVAARDSIGTGSESRSNPAALTRMNPRETRPSRTTVPLMSQVENSSMDTVLSTLLDELEHEHVRYVGIVATDVQDRIFLAQQVRRHLPNSALFMFSADILYVHPDANVDLRGTQIVTSYPLFPANYRWTPLIAQNERQTPELLFPTHTAQGVYNATLALLGHADRMQEYGTPFVTGDPPALWLSIVGASALQPVRILGAADTKDMVLTGPKVIPIPNEPLLAIVTFFATTLAMGPLPTPAVIPIPNHPWLPTIALLVCVVPAVFVAFNFGRADPTWPPHFVKGPLAELFSDTIFPAHRLPRRLYIFAGLSALMIAYVLTMAVFFLPYVAGYALRTKAPIARVESSALSLPFALAMLLGLFAVGSMLLYVGFKVLRQVVRGVRERWVRNTIGVGLAIGFFALVLLSVRVAAQWLFETPEAALLMYLRASDFGSGVSPLLPLALICGAAVAWSVSSLRRLRLLEGPDRLTPFLGFQGPSFEGIAELERAVLDAIGRRSTDLPWPILISVFGFLVLAWIRLFGPRSVPTGEGPDFDVLFAFGFLVVYTGLAFSFLRFVFIWRRLLRLLQRLAWHPTVKAYARLRQAIPGKPKVNLTSPSQIFTALEFSVDRAGQLTALARELTRPRKPNRPRQSLAVLGTLDVVPVGLLVSEPMALDADAFREESSDGLTSRLREKLTELDTHVSVAEAALHKALNAEASGDWRKRVEWRIDAEQALADMAQDVTNLIRPGWRLPAAYALQRTKDEPNEIQWFDMAEDFLTSRVAGFLSHVVPQLQNLIVFVTAGLLLMLLAVTSYPFQPHQLLLLFNTAVILAIVTTTAVVFVQMERETILSVLSESEPGQITWNRDFISRIGVYVVLPLISLLGAQFPQIAQQLFSWTSSFFGTN